MSNALAIAATTATLRNLLAEEIPKADTGLPPGITVTTIPLDVAAKAPNEDKPSLNLFLYQTVLNSAWRNQDMPRTVRPGETGAPPLALNLHYLITAYGKDDVDRGNLSQRVLGAAMSVLHDHAMLTRDEINIVSKDSGLDEQFERLRITPLATTVEDLSKLWMIFQTQYRISMAYEVNVVLIDSRLAVNAPLPVLKRGAADRGPVAVAGGAAILRQVVPPNLQSAARLGEEIIIRGEQISADRGVVRFSSSRLEKPIDLTPSPGDSEGEIRVRLPIPGDAGVMSDWAPGFYTLAFVETRPDRPQLSSNELPFALAPQITVAPLASVPGDIQLTVQCTPRMREGQRALLIFGSSQIAPASDATPDDATLPTTFVFDALDVKAGKDGEPRKYVVRLRIDGVDSVPVVYAGTPPIAEFDEHQTVEVAP